MRVEVTAEDWFARGERISYDPVTKEIAGPGEASRSETTVDVFHRVGGDRSHGDGSWTTFLPGFPDGSFGWAQVDRRLGELPRLFVEYVGQGDSDKPTDYPYGTSERADLVEAQWQAHGVASTFIVAFDYSSIVVLELLSRRLERLRRGVEPATRIEGVLLINGGLFADSHTHPWLTTPLLKSRLGSGVTWLAQRSRQVFDRMLTGLFSKRYGVTTAELDELYDAITRRDGAAFMSRAAGFVDEHRANAERWDLGRLYLASRDSVSFHVVGTEEDPFEARQVVAARERLGPYGLDVRVLPGGHLATSEQPDALAAIVREVVGAQGVMGDAGLRAVGLRASLARRLPSR